MHEEIKIPSGAKLIQMLAAVQASGNLNGKLQPLAQLYESHNLIYKVVEIWAVK